MRVLGFLMCGVFTGLLSFGQNWQDTGLPTEVIDWGDLYVDPSTNTMYATGINQAAPGQAGLFCTTENGWETIGLFGNVLLSTVRYNDTLVVAGSFYTVGSDSISNIAYIDSVGWHSYGSFDSGILRLRVLDDELYAVGGFRHVDGQVADGIAKRVGGQWEPVGDFGEVPDPYLVDVIKYQGTLVCCGNMDIIGEDYRDVYIYQNGGWAPLGGGLLGTASGGWVMTIYHDELILGGNFYISAGNAGQCIMRWNGSIWQPLGVGTTDNTDSYSSSYNIHALCVHDDKLFVGGGFSYAGHVPAQGIATWDGNQWCGLGSDLGLVHDIVFYNDTLYAMCGNNWIDGEHNNGGVRYRHITYGDTCSVVTAIPEGSNGVPDAFLALRNEEVIVGGLPDGTMPYRVHDLAGRTVLMGSLTSRAGSSSTINTGSLSAGSYVLQLAGRTGMPFLLP